MGAGGGGMHVPRALRGWASPINIDVLTQAPSATGQGTWAVAVSGTAINNAYFSNDGSGVDGDNVTFIFRCAAGTYTLYIMAQKNTNLGKLDVFLDGTKVVDANDLYAGSAEYANRITDTGNTLGAGVEHTIKFAVNGKNGSSGDHDIRITGVSLVRTA